MKSNATRIKTRLIGLALTAVTYLVGTAAGADDLKATPLPAKITVWRLNQPDQMIGRRIIYIGTNGYKVTYTEGHYSMVSSAPKWEVTYYNEDQKLICTKTMAQWKESMYTRAKLFKDSMYPESYTLSMGQPVKIKGHPCKVYVFTSNKPVDKNSIARTYFYVANELTVPAKMSEFFAVTWGKALTDHHMVGIDTELGSGYRAHKLETRDIDKIQVDANFFDAPKGYKVAHHESEVTLGDGIINDIVGDLGRQLGSGKK